MSNYKHNSKDLLGAITDNGYNCDCGSGGQDAMSIDTDYLHEVALEFARAEAAIQRVRDLLDTEPLFTARQNPATMYGWRMALRHMIDALDGDGAWMNYPQLAEAPVKVIHDRHCHGIPCVCVDGEQG